VADRFFLATILAGRLHVDGILELGPWQASRLQRRLEDHLDLVLSTSRKRKVRTTEELDAAMKEPMSVAPTRDAWFMGA
jgi:hypothetical protein